MLLSVLMIFHDLVWRLTCLSSRDELNFPSHFLTLIHSANTELSRIGYSRVSIVRAVTAMPQAQSFFYMTSVSGAG